MSTSEENDSPQVDEQTKERSAEQRNITAPTPPEVRAKGDDDTEPPAGESRSS
ncbi:hypothetical protein [Streptomyces capoamus]|uniref:Uncharacterized protein n=1 Tax=Streptomyces capoamus TaxID=68183 RepID=A0A919EUG1_9ACTN|nr:hypothetical protein [Streptomyces capoamus]GGW13791.1 hypothetical protein GCM10010501_19030 [Streptomyces libani subsp. rufus]GHG40866.1 hypothetical protein GCM10018980_15510 [Streptomyces capoamus]